MFLLQRTDIQLVNIYDVKEDCNHKIIASVIRTWEYKFDSIIHSNQMRLV
jgi:hypothetical protein